ncbi:hypothetical protein NX059_008674 [Plenodomus lindquistii]|nr:hypothetical protein NX059_008674 [Plenodomus lindquistii]
MPSIDHIPIDRLSMWNPHKELRASFAPLEIRGVYGGRKRRYVIERAEGGSCPRECKKKIVCLPTLGEVLNDCKCRKCPTGFPALDGKSCAEKCPDGQETNDRGGCCPIGQKPTAKGDACEVKQPNDERKGACPEDTVLDPKHGWDPNPKDIKCQIDDEKGCPKPKLAATRPEGKENDPTYTPACGDPDEKEPQCNPKTQYTHVYVDSENKATRSCKQTRKFYDRKRTKPTNSSIRAKIKDMWNKHKPDYDTKEKERQDSLKKLKELQGEREKQAKELSDKVREKNDKKKERMAKCNTPIALLMGATFSEAMSKREEAEHPYDYTTMYFDEEYITSDDRLNDWPPDIDVEQISADVDTDAFLEKWDEIMDDKRRPGSNCNFIGKRSLDRRCSQKRSLEDWFDDNILETLPGNISSLIQGSTLPGPVDNVIVTQADLEKRNPVAWLFNLMAFGTRIGVSLVARATASVAARSPRLANLLKNPERLFQTAPKGQGTKAGQKGMENAKNTIKTDYKRWWNCLKEGMP